MKEEKTGLYEQGTQICIPTYISACEKGIYHVGWMEPGHGGCNRE
jgi:hypothetical protein